MTNVTKKRLATWAEERSSVHAGRGSNHLLASRRHSSVCLLITVDDRIGNGMKEADDGGKERSNLTRGRLESGSV